MRVFSLGYEGLDQDAFVALLRRHGIRHVADVRDLPLSRKKGFSKTPLRTCLGQEGIGYSNPRALGAPRDLRQAKRAGMALPRFRAAYAAHLRDGRKDLDALVRQALLQPTAMVCYERDPRQCHRFVLAARLRRRGLKVQDLP
ncbi:MAG TPA: DUF488 domain-containing protein [Candidatus Thermoplasmatota archaeon]|nr:DUF488 domain-containing protein [Candidatus Thermoplasmatota archaeon]